MLGLMQQKQLPDVASNKGRERRRKEERKEEEKREN
jgi:hypothetical protein